MLLDGQAVGQCQRDGDDIIGGEIPQGRGSSEDVLDVLGYRGAKGPPVGGELGAYVFVPDPRSAAVSIMFAVAWPKSYISQSRCSSSSDSLATRAIVAADWAMCFPPRSQTFASSISCSRSVTIAKFHGCQFADDGAHRPASTMRSRFSRAIGWSVYWRTLRRARMASHVSMSWSLSHGPPGPHLGLANNNCSVAHAPP